MRLGMKFLSRTVGLIYEPPPSKYFGLHSLAHGPRVKKILIIQTIINLPTVHRVGDPINQYEIA
jgi:hypothetical protein